MPVRPDYTQLLNTSSFQLIPQVFGPPKVYDVVAPLDNNGKPFATVHVGVRTTLLLAFYAPWRTEALSLMGVCAAYGAVGGLAAEQPCAAADGENQPPAWTTGLTPPRPLR